MAPFATAQSNASTSELLLRIQRLENDFSLLKESCGDNIDGENDRKLVLSKPLTPTLSDARCLPLKAWFCGPTSMDGPSYLTWDEATAPLALAIRLSTMHAPAIELDVTRELRSITYLNPDEVGNGYPVMAVVRKAVNPDDTGQLSRITLQFDSRNADWSGARYRALVEWLTARAVGQGIDVSVSRPLVAETLWDTAARVAQRHESETSNPHSGCVQIVSAVPAEAATAGERGNESAVVNAQGHVEPAGNANARSGEQNGIQIGNTVTPPSVPPERLQNSDAGCVRIDPEDMRIQPVNWVNCMRVKNPLPATIPHGGRPKPSPTNKSFLPIKAWILGRKLFEEPYHLVWATDGRLTIRSGDAPGSPSRHSEEADLPSLAKCVWFVDPKEDFPDKFFILETYEKNKRQKPMAVNYTSFFKQGASHGEGDIMLKFNTESPAWTIATYTAFVDWFKVHVQSRQIFRGRAGVARWDTSNRMVLLAETRIKREPHSGVKRHADGEVDPASRKKRKIVTRNNG